MILHLFMWWLSVAVIVAVLMLADDVLRHIGHEKVNPVRSLIIAAMWFPLACVVAIVMFRLWRGSKRKVAVP